jgi:hypothetical protein
MSHENVNSNDCSGEAPLLMPQGTRYAGQPVDTSCRHSIEIKPSGDGHMLIDPKDAHVVVDYFYHEGQFWRAIIPLDGIAEIFGQAFNFSKVRTKRGVKGPEIRFDRHGLPKRTIPFLNHLQCRFVMKSDCYVNLYPIKSDETGAPAHRIKDFVYSVEVVGPVGVGFNIRDGLRGNLLGAHRFLSTREMIFERIVLENQHVTESPRLPLNDLEQRAALTESLLRSHRAGMSDRYYLYRVCGTNNCTSNPFQILDKIVTYSFRHRIGSMLYRLPFSPRLYLRARGLDSDPSVRKMVRSEFEDYIQDPATQQRRRKYLRQLAGDRQAARQGRAT